MVPKRESQMRDNGVVEDEERDEQGAAVWLAFQSVWEMCGGGEFGTPNGGTGMVLEKCENVESQGSA